MKKTLFSILCFAALLIGCKKETTPEPIIPATPIVAGEHHVTFIVADSIYQKHISPICKHRGYSGSGEWLFPETNWAVFSPTLQKGTVTIIDTDAVVEFSNDYYLSCNTHGNFCPLNDNALIIFDADTVFNRLP